MLFLKKVCFRLFECIIDIIIAYIIIKLSLFFTTNRLDIFSKYPPFVTLCINIALLLAHLSINGCQHNSFMRVILKCELSINKRWPILSVELTFLMSLVCVGKNI